MIWLWMFLKNPADALDWHSKDGKLDHGKVVPDCLLVAVVMVQSWVCVQTKQLPPVGVLIVEFSAAFGYGMFRTFLRSKDVTSAETVNLDVKWQHGVEAPVVRPIISPDDEAR